MSWYVLVEANEYHSGDNVWRLVDKVPVDGGREAAIARAEETSRTWVRGTPPEGEGRLVFRTSETSWLVERSSYKQYEGTSDPIKQTRHLRVSVAELVMAREPARLDPPKKGWLRR
ncbi:hypothetical protein [Streptomyces sp. NPDC047981]|uniref:hypothetical protein n=1 Tax=Streptomyces sp. NPDC047981 TaxID=3154610 RepID=UPI003418FB6F